MAHLLGHEKLKAYQKGMDFIAIRRALLDGLPRLVAAGDHLDRGAESMLVNIANIALKGRFPLHLVPHLIGYA